MPEIEFTDRYGGRTPSWLRSCHSECEAMGCVPITQESAQRERNYRQYYIVAWQKAEAANPSEDGWHFVKCPHCQGSGRVSWIVTIVRVPKWLFRGLKFCLDFRNDFDGHWWRNFFVRFKCSFVYDILRLRN